MILDLLLFVIVTLIWLGAGLFAAHSVFNFENPTLTTPTRIFLGIWSVLWLGGGGYQRFHSFVGHFAVVRCVADLEGLSCEINAWILNRKLYFKWADVDSVSHSDIPQKSYTSLYVFSKGQRFAVDHYLEIPLAIKLERLWGRMQKLAEKEVRRARRRSRGRGLS